MRSMSLSVRLWAIAAATLLGSITLVAVCVRSVNVVKIRGPIYSDIVMYKDLLADILPPPEYLIESYLNCFELLQTKAAERQPLLDKAARLEKDFLDRREVWDKSLTQPQIRQAMLDDAIPAGLEFLKIVKTQFLPLVRDGRDDEARAVLEGPLAAAYTRHRSAVDKTVALSNKEVDVVEAHADKTLAANMTILLGAAAGINTIVLLLTIWAVRSILRPMRRLNAYAQGVANGDYSSTCTINGACELRVLGDVLMDTAAKVRENIERAGQAQAKAQDEAANARNAMSKAAEAERYARQAMSKGMAHAAEKLEKVVEIVGAASQQLSTQIELSNNGARKQAQRAAEVAASMEQMNASVLEVAENASHTADTSSRAQDKAKEGAGVVRQVIESISTVQGVAVMLKEQVSDLSRESESIGEIMNVISEIADQTNLLALNAAIEAARAGDAGRGFAGVADEVRKLAEKTMHATKEVGEAILSVQRTTQSNIANVESAVQAVASATDLAGRSGMALEDIVHLVETASTQVQSIAAAAEEQSAASEEINHAVEEVNTVASETSKTMDEASRSVLKLSRQAVELRGLIQELKSDAQSQA
jgi:methyl-accepting chemotaxis protein